MNSSLSSCSAASSAVCPFASTMPETSSTPSWGGRWTSVSYTCMYLTDWLIVTSHETSELPLRPPTKPRNVLCQCDLLQSGPCNPTHPSQSPRAERVPGWLRARVYAGQQGKSSEKCKRKQKFKLCDINILIIRTLELIKWIVNLVQPKSPNHKGYSL